jgi:hypothetical protein
MHFQRHANKRPRAGRRGISRSSHSSTEVWTRAFRRLNLEGTKDRVAQSVEQRTSSGQTEPRAGRSGTAMSECRSMLERPQSRAHHNVAGNSERDGTKSERIG